MILMNHFLIEVTVFAYRICYIYLYSDSFGKDYRRNKTSRNLHLHRNSIRSRDRVNSLQKLHMWRRDVYTEGESGRLFWNGHKNGYCIINSRLTRRIEICHNLFIAAFYIGLSIFCLYYVLNLIWIYNLPEREHTGGWRYNENNFASVVSNKPVAW